MGRKNEGSAFASEVSEMVTAIFNMMDMHLEDITELERQIVSAFSFGMINGAAMEAGADPAAVQGTMTGILIGQFGYSEKQAVDFMQQLIESTNREFHPTMNAIIHRGIEGFYEYKEQEYSKLHENLSDILAALASTDEE